MSPFFSAEIAIDLERVAAFRRFLQQRQPALTT
jgi:hypothetical protein